MSSIQDITNEDLQRFMYSEPPDNIVIINEALEKHHIVHSTNVYEPKEHMTRDRFLFSDPIRRELSKVRPGYAEWRRRLILYGGVCCLFAIFSAVSLPSPYNMIMAAGCLGPIGIAAIKRRRHGHSNLGISTPEPM